MKNRQLMRLNKVLHKGEVKTVDCISPGYVSFIEDRPKDEKDGLGGGWIDLDDVEFIPLTEEWLDIKFFLEEIETGYWQLTEDVIISTEGQCYAVDDLDNRVWIAEIFKVHQLQNLYFALTGEELVIEHGL